jgi:hypothetical protein
MLCKYRTTDDGKTFTEADFRKLLGVFFKDDPVIMNAEPSDEMVEILWEAVNASHRAAEALGFVPRPAGGPPGAAYIAGIFVRSARELGRPKKGKRFVALPILSTVKSQLRTKMRLAAMSSTKGGVCAQDQ